MGMRCKFVVANPLYTCFVFDDGSTYAKTIIVGRDMLDSNHHEIVMNKDIKNAERHGQYDFLKLRLTFWEKIQIKNV